MIEASAILKGNGLQIEAEYQERLDDLLRICHAQLKTVDEELIIQAFRLGYWAHRNDLRASGELYIAHPLEVAKIYVERIGFDDVGVAAALLHDVVEDTDLSLEFIRETFGESLALIIDGLTKISSAFETKHISKAENVRKLILSMATDIRVIFVKFADRLHNMRTLESLPPHKQVKIATETLNLFAPLAHRFGFFAIKSELEDLCLAYIHPDEYEEITSGLRDSSPEREKYIASFISPLKTRLDTEGFEFEIYGRSKNLYSIYRKMKRQDKPLKEIYDIFAIRIVLDGEGAKGKEDCWRVYSIITDLYKPLTERFRDFVSVPKSNGYQSLHTTVLGPEGRRVEIQIRTRDMHEIAEKGFAAHWKYKEDVDNEDTEMDRLLTWVRDLLENPESGAASDFVRDFSLNLYDEEIYIFTPRGDLFTLPSGACPVDFAYLVHTQVGFHCIGAKVNGKMVPLTYKLVTGERVEIISGKNNRPSLDWLSPHHGYVNTQRARSKIQAWFRHENRDETLAISRQSLDRELERLGLQAVNHERLAQRCGLSSLDELCFKLADGSFKLGRAMSIAQKMVQPAPGVEFTPAGDASQGKALGRRVFKDKHTEDHGIQISGVGNLLTKLARCCNPLPGDEILGFLTQGRGVTVHRSNCKNLLHHRTRSPERVLEVQWGVQDVGKLPAKIHVSAYDRKGLLKDIAAVFADAQTNILEMNTQTNTADQTVNMFVTGEIDNIEVLSAVLTKLSQLSHVNWARRVSQ